MVSVASFIFEEEIVMQKLSYQQGPILVPCTIFQSSDIFFNNHLMENVAFPASRLYREIRELYQVPDSSSVQHTGLGLTKAKPKD